MGRYITFLLQGSPIFPAGIAATKETQPVPSRSVPDGNRLLGFLRQSTSPRNLVLPIYLKMAPGRVSHWPLPRVRTPLRSSALMRALAGVGGLFARRQRLLCSFPHGGEPSDRHPGIFEGDGDDNW